jgi:hypothetical protein
MQEGCRRARRLSGWLCAWKSCDRARRSRAAAQFVECAGVVGEDKVVVVAAKTDACLRLAAPAATHMC